ncbi:MULTISPECIES: UPF0158 family protein [unclassified Arthrobacter]|uniref:UPF0158 family protein n=1 Tax=unclassified Arthrobacter TaxID=235627 RepID=UPI00159E42F3|nr:MULTISPECIES: UPF0158 family protein [unclassified Arthrobacter]MCQ9162747.1 UPF0158 family protein [Arthrobacter sp. STN4]NVM97270.1 hypothetical protein [Arthrobacter sp. SDTb3-6]
MLPLNVIDLDTLVTALENQFMDYDTFFWLDPATGRIALWGEETADEAEAEGWDVDDRGGIRIDTVDSSEGFRDMEDFIARVKEPQCRARLQRAIAHSSPFRHFKDALYSFPKQQTAWYEFHDWIMKQRAIRWLASVGVVDTGEADAAIARLREAT